MWWWGGWRGEVVGGRVVFFLVVAAVVAFVKTNYKAWFCSKQQFYKQYKVEISDFRNIYQDFEKMEE